MQKDIIPIKTHCTKEGCGKEVWVKKILKKNLCRRCKNGFLHKFNKMNEEQKMLFYTELADGKNSFTVKLNTQHIKRNGENMALSINNMGIMGSGYTHYSPFKSYKKKYDPIYMGIIKNKIKDPSLYINLELKYIHWRYFLKRKMDLDNIFSFQAKVVGDACKNMGLITDDNICVIKKHVVEFIGYDINRRGKVFITFVFD